MGAWSAESKSHVAHMSQGDFYASELSTTLTSADTLKIQLVAADGSVSVLKDKVTVLAGEVIDAATMSKKALRAFYEQEIAAAKQQDVLLSLHLKATMMKVSDPIMFGHAVVEFFKPVFDKHAALFNELGVDVNNGAGDMFAGAFLYAISQNKDFKTAAEFANIAAAKVVSQFGPRLKPEQYAELKEGFFN